MKVATLGPKYTDSFRSAEYWIDTRGVDGCEIVGYQSFESLFDNLECSDYVIMPMGYTNRDSSEFMGWVDYHFFFEKLLDTQEIYLLPTKEMALVENTSYKKEGVVLQSATYQFARSSLDLDKRQYVYESSKVKAFNKFIDEEYHYVICSVDICQQEKKKKNLSLKIIKNFSPVMSWIVYKVNLSKGKE